MSQNENKPTSRPASRRPAQKKPARTAVSSSGKGEKRTVVQDKGGQRKVKATEKPTNTALSSVVKAVIYICFVLVSAAALSYFGITAGNDVFAFSKPDREIEITTEPGVTVKSLAAQLGEKGVIRYPKVFELYAKLRKKDSGLIAVTETVSPSMDYDSLLAAFKPKKKERQTVRLTIPEGYTVDEVIDLLVKNEIGTKEGYISAIQDYPFDYWFVQEIDNATLRYGRRYRLEGYLYPDTYYFYTDSTEVAVIDRFLANFDQKYSKKFRDRTAELGWTVDDVITLASMIQMEGKFESDYGAISSVFHNRLNTNKTDHLLGSDATVLYALGYRVKELTAEQLATDSPYNTRLYPGLPPGPISNATVYGINYALYPSETNYYYFVSKKDGTTLFAETYAEHLANVELVRSE